MSLPLDSASSDQKLTFPLRRQFIRIKSSLILSDLPLANAPRPGQPPCFQRLTEYDKDIYYLADLLIMRTRFERQVLQSSLEARKDKRF